MSLRNDLSKHQVFLQRLTGTEYKSIMSYLEQLQKTAGKHLDANLADKELKQALRSVTKGMKDTAIQNMTDFAEYESKFSAKTISKYTEDALEAVDADKLKKALTTNNMAVNANVEKGTKKSLDTAYKQFAQRKADEITQVIKDGRVLGLAADEIKDSVAARVLGLQSTQARSLAATAVNFTTNLARTETLFANKEIVPMVICRLGDAFEHTDYCLGVADTVHELGDEPSFPAHYGCVSYTEPYLDE